MKKIYTIIIFILAFSQIYAVSDPTAGLKEISLSGLTTANDYTFHFYSTDGKLNRGFSEFFIALSDKNNNYIDSFTVSNFYPLMDMGMMKHSSPVGKVEKVAGKALYRTWISFLMSSNQGGSWSLSFDYTIGKGSTKSAIISTPLKSDILKDAPIYNNTITQIGWFKDRDCVWGPNDSVALPLQSSCWVSCGTGTGGMAGCFNSGLGVFIYNPKESGEISIDSAQKAAYYLLADPQSKELIRAFLEQLSNAADQKISVKVTGYWIKNGISANSNETYVPEISPDSSIHYLDAFRYLSIEGVVIPGDTNSYSGFATNSYKLTPQDLAPSNLSLVNYAGGVTVKFTPPANKADIGTSNLTGYKISVYNADGVLQNKFTTIKNDTSVKSINIPGLKTTAGYTYTVSALYPLSGVEVESEKNALANNISGIALQVDDYAANSKWLDKFSYNDTTYFISVAYPKSLIVGSQTIKAYINKEVDLLKPFPVAYGGFKIVPTPFMRSMGHGSSGNTNLEWNTTDSVYEGTLKFSMEGDWRVNLKIYDAIADTLIAGVDLNENGDNSTHYWDFYLETMDTTGIKNIKQNGILVYPTLSQGEITIVSPAEARIKVIGLTGQTIGYYQSSGSKTIQMNAPSGLYFVLVESSGKIFTQKVIIKK